MDNVYIVGLLYMVIGTVLLFFGAKFMNLVLVVLGGFLGINFGQVLVAWFGTSGFWAFLLIALCAIAAGYLAVMFYKWFIAIGLGYFAGLLAYYVLLNWNMSHSWAIVFSVIVAVLAFFAVWKLDVVENMFKFLSSIEGAIALTAGLYVLFHKDLLNVLQTNHNDVLLGASGWWILFWILAFGAGLGYQLSSAPKTATA